MANYETAFKLKVVKSFLVDVEVKEARECVRSALQNAGLEFPLNKHITVKPAPADLHKDSGRFDLPIVLGVVAASGQIDDARLASYEFAGEMSGWASCTLPPCD